MNKIVIAIILSVAFGIMLGRLSYAHVCEETVNCSDVIEKSELYHQVINEWDVVDCEAETLAQMKELKRSIEYLRKDVRTMHLDLLHK